MCCHVNFRVRPRAAWRWTPGSWRHSWWCWVDSTHSKRQALHNTPHLQTSCQCKKTLKKWMQFSQSWWRGGRDVIPAFLFNSARAAALARAQQLYSFHFRWRLGLFIRFASWGLLLDVEAKGSSSSESDLTEFESSLSSSVFEHLEPQASRSIRARVSDLGQTQPTSCTLFQILW